jgi:hypothetical protein
MISYDIPVRDLCSLSVSWKVMSVFDGDEVFCSVPKKEEKKENNQLCVVVYEMLSRACFPKHVLPLFENVTCNMDVVRFGFINFWRQRTDDHFDDPRHRLPMV